MSGVELHTRLLACLCAGLAATADPSPELPQGGFGPVRSDACCLVHSQDLPPADYCCEGPDGMGQAWVRTSGFDPQAQGTCGNAGIVTETIGLGVYRCAPSFANDDGDPPSCDALTLHSQRMRVDADAIRDAVRCCPALSDLSWTFVQMIPISGGACAGWEYRMRITWEEPQCPIRTPGGPVAH